MATSRLLTLTGAGGSGKGRLALEAANQLLPAFRDGVWLVELFKLRQPSQVPEAIASVLDIEFHPGEAPVENFKRSLSRKQLLLVLDNFEHLMEAGIFVGELLEVAPQVAVLATSREKLHLYGEHEFPVLPLVVPGQDHRQTADQLRTFDAVKLFADRARAAQPGFELTPENLPQVAGICVKLDSLPLAIELCAPQVKMFLPAEILRRLQTSLDSLPPGPRNLPARQRTMRAALEWSTDLLDGDEKLLFHRMAVFEGGATLDAVENVCAPGTSANPLDPLTSLVDRNLVSTREARAGEVRFNLLAIVRELNFEHLRLSGDTDIVYRLHARYFTELVEEAFAKFSTPRHTYWFARMQDEVDNIRSAFSWTLSEGEAELSLRLAAGLRDYWPYYRLYAEGRRYAEAAIENAGDAPAGRLAGVLMALGYFCLYLSDLACARQRFQNALALYSDMGDEENTAWCNVFFSGVYLQSPDKVRYGQELANQSLAYFRESENLAGMARAHNILGELSRVGGDYISAREHYEACLQLSIKTGERLRESFQYVNLGLVAFKEKDYALSVDLNLKALKILYDMDTSLGMASHLAALAGPTAALG